MSSLQDQDPWTNICLDLQPQDKGEAKQVDPGRCGTSAADIMWKSWTITSSYINEQVKYKCAQYELYL